jgi:hypothetical protein
VRLPCFLALRSPLLIASRMEVSPIPVRALASSGDTESRSESGTLPFCPNSFITETAYTRECSRPAFRHPSAIGGVSCHRTCYALHGLPLDEGTALDDAFVPILGAKSDFRHENGGR